jgi:hypothetical protein
VLQVLFVFAIVLEDIGVCKKFVRNLYREGFRVRLRIIKGYFVVQCPKSRRRKRSSGA